MYIVLAVRLQHLRQQRSNTLGIKTKPTFFIVVILVAASVLTLGGESFAQCYGNLSVSPDFFKYDYIVRMAVHFGDESLIPEDIICSRSIHPGESPIEVPIYFYNAHSGVMRLYFAIESCDSIVSFEPQNGFSVITSSTDLVSGNHRMNIKIDAGVPVCGPALAGYAYIKPSGRYDPVWITIVKNHQFDRLVAVDEYGNEHYAFSPQYGGYVGSSYMYTCQEPICEEPNNPVMDLVAEVSYGNSVKLTWVAGSGDHTIVRYSIYGYPQGYDDGEHVVTVESAPGQEQYYFHTNPPLGALIYYTAFSVTEGVSEEVIKNSFVECGAMDTTFTNYKIDAEQATWGAIKGKMNSR